MVWRGKFHWQIMPHRICQLNLPLAYFVGCGAFGKFIGKFVPNLHSNPLKLYNSFPQITISPLKCFPSPPLHRQMNASKSARSCRILLPSANFGVTGRCCRRHISDTSDLPTANPYHTVQPYVGGWTTF